MYGREKVFYHRSFRPNDNEGAFSHGANLLYNTLNWEAEWNHEIVGEGYDARVGFVRRTNYERITPRLEYKWYPDSDKINRFGVEVENDMLWAENQGLTDRETSVSFSIRPEGSGFTEWAMSIPTFSYWIPLILPERMEKSCQQGPLMKCTEQASSYFLTLGKNYLDFSRVLWPVLQWLSLWRLRRTQPTCCSFRGLFLELLRQSS